MSFRETLGAIFRLYWKIFIPILILNIIVNYFTLGIGIVAGVFIGPILIMTSNAILGKRVKAWQSIKKGTGFGTLFKLSFVSIGYIVITALLSVAILLLVVTIDPSGSDASAYIWMLATIAIYLFLAPLWIFVPMIMLLEKKGLWGSIKRSFQIIKRNFRRIVQMDLFINLALVVFAYLFSLMVGDPDPFINFLAGAVFAFVLATVTGLNTLPYVFVYYEYRARHENYTEELMTQELGLQTMDEMMTI